MAQFRVEFVLDQATGKYLAEVYHPERDDEVVVRTQPVYASQAEAVLGLVQLFERAMGETPAKPRRSAKKKQKRRAAKPRSTRRPQSGKTKRRR